MIISTKRISQTEILENMGGAAILNWLLKQKRLHQGPFNNPNAEIKLQFDYDGGGTGKGGLATVYVDGEKVAEGRVEKTQPLVYSADETADVGIDEATQVADQVFKDVDDTDFTGFVTDVTISIPESES